MVFIFPLYNLALTSFLVGKYRVSKNDHTQEDCFTVTFDPTFSVDEKFFWTIIDIWDLWQAWKSKWSWRIERNKAYVNLEKTHKDLQ